MLFRQGSILLEDGEVDLWEGCCRLFVLCVMFQSLFSFVPV